MGIVSLGSCAITRPELGIPVGGAELQLYLLGCALAATGKARVTRYVADCGQGEAEESDVLVRPLVRLNASHRFSAGAALAMTRRLWRGAHDVYVTRGASSVNGLTWFASRWAGGRHLHMFAHDDECNGRADVTLSRPARWLHHLGVKRADALTCQSVKQQEAVRRVFGREARLVASLLGRSPSSAPSAANGGALWVGRDIEWKRPELFLDLARRLPEETFTMVCQPQAGRDLERLRRLAPGNVTFFPGLPFDETARLFGRHRVLVCTSSAEGFPNTMLQAACAGAPVVSLCVDPDGVLARFGAGIACGDSMDELAHSTQEAMRDGEQRELLRVGAARLAQSVAEREEELVRLVVELRSCQ